MNAHPGLTAPLLVVVGMKAEARIVRRPGVTVIVGGGQSDMVSRQVELALGRGARRVLSFGLCGGLDPSLKAGDCVVGSAVIGAGARWPADPEWTARLARTLPGSILAEIAGVDAIVASPGEKVLLHEQTGAAAVDMESHIVARLAHSHGAPFAVLRAVSDPAGHALPPAAKAGFKADGAADAGAVLRELVRRPGDLGALIRTARYAGAALRALRDARDLLGPGLGLSNLVEHPVDVA